MPKFAFLIINNVMKVLCLVSVLLLSVSVCGQQVSGNHKQKSFPDQVVAGNYSGICHVKGNRYAMVSDKSPTDGFFYLDIDVDSVDGRITRVDHLRYVDGRSAHRDAEGICFLPRQQSILVVGEADHAVREYDEDGVPTGRVLQLEQAGSDYGYESLTFDAVRDAIWTCTEQSLPRDHARSPSLSAAPVIRLQQFDTSLNPVAQYAYAMDSSYVSRKSRKKPVRWRNYAYGVSELMALDDGSLLVLEREFYVPKRKVGAWVRCRLFTVRPESSYAFPASSSLDTVVPLPKRLLCEWKSSLHFTRRSLANYEGMCAGPLLPDGSRVVLLVSDSQNRAGGVLKDWFKSIVIKY